MELAKNTFRIYIKIKNIAAKLSAIDPKYHLLAPTQDIYLTMNQNLKNISNRQPLKHTMIKVL